MLNFRTTFNLGILRIREIDDAFSESDQPTQVSYVYEVERIIRDLKKLLVEQRNAEDVMLEYELDIMEGVMEDAMTAFTTYHAVPHLLSN